nr:hypothetical protein [Tanacetum cinerariifolium]
MSQFGQITHTHQYVVPFHTKKLFTTLWVNSPSFSERIVPLFDTMLLHQDEPASLVRDVSKGEAYPTESGFLADQDMATIAKSSTLPHDSAPRENREGIAATRSEHDAPIKERIIDEGEAATERISDDLEELARVLTSMDAATVLTGGINVSTGSVSIPTAGPPIFNIPTG